MNGGVIGIYRAFANEQAPPPAPNMYEHDLDCGGQNGLGARRRLAVARAGAQALVRISAEFIFCLPVVHHAHAAKIDRMILRRELTRLIYSPREWFCGSAKNL